MEGFTCCGKLQRKAPLSLEPNKKTSFIKSFEPFHRQIQELG
ncbi:MAG: hypothetical protein ACLTW9_01485 [Enterocloster sp.]